MSTAHASQPLPAASRRPPRHLSVVPEPTVPDPAGDVLDLTLEERSRRAVARLWARYKATGDPHARAALITRYQPLVRSVAGRVSAGLPQLVDPADLVGYGSFGLIDAIEKFDPERDSRFETYAVARIRGAIIDELRGLDWVPRSVRLRAREVERAGARLEARLGRAPTPAELAAEAGITVAALRRVLAEVSLGGVVALDARLGGPGQDGQRLTLGDTVADREAGPMELFEAEETRQIVAGAVNGLDEREKLVISLIYYEGLTLARIAAVLGVTESRVCQIHTKALGRLRVLVRRSLREGPGPHRPEPVAA